MLVPGTHTQSLCFVSTPCFCPLLILLPPLFFILHLTFCSHKTSRLPFKFLPTVLVREGESFSLQNSICGEVLFYLLKTQTFLLYWSFSDVLHECARLELQSHSFFYVHAVLRAVFDCKWTGYVHGQKTWPHSSPAHSVQTRMSNLQWQPDLSRLGDSFLQSMCVSVSMKYPGQCRRWNSRSLLPIT